MASASGVECRSTVASDSPTLVRNLRDISLREFRTSLSRGYRLLLIQNVSGVAVLCAQPNEYWLPTRAIEPSRTAALAVRSQIC